MRLAHQTLVVYLLLVVAKANNLTYIPCPNKSTCPDNETCCKLNIGYGCCPYADGVCCSDHVSCCPSGTQCDLDHKRCIQGGSQKLDKVFENLKEKKPTTHCGEDVCEMENAVCCEGFCCPQGHHCINDKKNCSKETYLFFKFPLKAPPGEEISVKKECPNPEQSCQEKATCCESPTPNKYACCPLKNAVCCSDKLHCCPYGYSCDVAENVCIPKAVIVPGKEFRETPKKLQEVRKSERKLGSICDKIQPCRSDETCCPYLFDFGCCPMRNAVCCNDGEHCCPHNTKCDISKQLCIDQNQNTQPMIRKAKNRSLINTIYNTLKGKKPDEESNFERDCCQGEPNSNCCPTGYSCHKEKGFCKLDKQPESMIIEEIFEDSDLDKTQDECLAKGLCKSQDGGCQACQFSNNPPKLNDVIHCPGSNKTCSLHQKCCDGNNGFFCCQFKHGSCCKKTNTCCNRNHHCGEDGSCILNDGVVLEQNNPKRKFCPDKKTKCPFPNTCCKSGDEYKCCGLKHGVCCPDGKHCCKKGYICDPKNNSCTRKDFYNDLLAYGHPFLYPKSLEQIEFANLNTNFCPDKKTKCKGTCCADHRGHYKCCRFENGVCCRDGRHCCPKGSHCDERRKRCVHDRTNFYNLFNMFDAENSVVFTKTSYTAETVRNVPIFVEAKRPRFTLLPKAYCSAQNCGPEENCCFLPGRGVQCCSELE